MAGLRKEVYHVVFGCRDTMSMLPLRILMWLRWGLDSRIRVRWRRFFYSLLEDLRRGGQLYLRY